MDPSQFAIAVHLRLLDFFGYPEWSSQVAPLDVLVGTILSQNTNDQNRDRAYEALRRRFPTWEAVRDAPEAEVVEARLPGLKMRPGLGEWERERFPKAVTDCRRILPQDNDTEPFFVALIGRPA